MKNNEMDFFKPKKYFSQNFLWDKNIAKKIVETFNLSNGDVVVEIGVGKGIITQFLLERQIHYIGYEIDKQLYSTYERVFLSNNCLFYEFVLEDFLKTNLEVIYSKFNRKLMIIGNIPYGITGRVLFKLIENCKIIKKATLMVQKEVARRILASPNTKDYGIFSIIFKLISDVEMCFDVSPSCFFPKPKVYSSVINISFKDSFEPNFDVASFIDFLGSAFSHRRKQLINTIFKKYDFEAKEDVVNLYKNKRVEQLSPSEILNLYILASSKK